MTNIAHIKKLNSSSETSGVQTVTHFPVNVGVSDAGSEPSMTEDVIVECAKPDIAPPPMEAATPVTPAVPATSAYSVRTNVYERLREKIYFYCFS